VNTKVAAHIVSDMKTISLRTEKAVKVLQQIEDIAGKEVNRVMKVIDATLTGVGKNLDTSV